MKALEKKKIKESFIYLNQIIRAVCEIKRFCYYSFIFSNRILLKVITVIERVDKSYVLMSKSTILQSLDELTLAKDNAFQKTKEERPFYKKSPLKMIGAITFSRKLSFGLSSQV